MEDKEPRSIWGKIAIITAFLSALGLFLKDCSGGGSNAPIIFNAPPAPSYNYTPPIPQPPVSTEAYSCCDVTGLQRCPLLYPAPRGSGCFCPNQGTGFSC